MQNLSVCLVDTKSLVAIRNDVMVSLWSALFYLIPRCSNWSSYSFADNSIGVDCDLLVEVEENVDNKLEVASKFVARLKSKHNDKDTICTMSSRVPLDAQVTPWDSHRQRLQNMFIKHLGPLL